VPTVKGYEHLPIGTWFVGAKVKSDEYWNKIKSGELNGWSIHGVFRQEKVEMSNQSNEQIERIINRIFYNISK
jgi:hypothetical protein